MKKFFFLAVAATMTFAACNKTEVVYDEGPQEIAFSAVNKVATKTPVDGTDFLTDDNMQVAAYIVEGTTPANFFGKTLFQHSSDKIWSGAPARYWPLTTSTINFLAVTEKGGKVDNTEVTFATENYASGATVALANNAGYDQNDLMFAAGQGKHVQGGAYNAVDMKFKHALSWINFQVKNSDATSTTEGKQYTVVVNSISLNAAAYNGTLTLTNTNYNSKNTADVSTDNVTASWISAGTVEKVLVPNVAGTANAATVTLTVDNQLFGNGLLVIPGKAGSFTINYTLHQSDGTANTFDYTYNLPENTNWEMAKKYFYNINITLREIEIAPTITDWDDQGKPTPLS